MLFDTCKELQSLSDKRFIKNCMQYILQNGNQVKNDFNNCGIQYCQGCQKIGKL